MKAELDRALSAQNGQLMLKSDKFEFERRAVAKTKNEDRYNGRENRHHDRDGTRPACENHQPLSALLRF
jgi:hypothetical protein